MPYFRILLILLIIGGLFYGFVLADTTSTLRPTADGGDDSAEWKNFGNIDCNTADCYTEVDEASGSSCANSDGDASYIQGDVAGTSQTFDIDESSLQDNATITQIDITVCYKSGAPGGDMNDFQTRYCVNDSCFNSGVNITTGANYTETTQSHSGLSIIKNASTDLEAGVALTGAAGELIRISQISAVISYTPFAPAPDCGDGNLDQGEECDDGNNDNGDGCSATCQIETEEPSTPAAPSEPPLPVSPSGGRRLQVLLSGQAYPGSKIEVFRRSIGDTESQNVPVPLETHAALQNGTFDLSLGLLLSEKMFFALRAEDKDGRKTDIISFDVDFAAESVLEAKNILVPPTIGFAKTVVSRGKEISVLGYAAPNSIVEIKIDNAATEKTKPNSQGFWTFDIATTSLQPGEHQLKIRQINQSGKESVFSSPKSFKVSLLKFPEVDFNGDEKVNIADWSIFLFRWSQNDEQIKSSIDLNNDGKINIYDFSVFLNVLTL